MPTPEPGVYPGVSFDDYSEWDAANHSLLVHFSKTPAHAYYASIHQKEKPTTNLGHLVHTAILEPALLEKEYFPVPKIDKRTKAGKAAWAKAEADANGRLIVLPSEMECALALKAHAQQHPTLREMLESRGANELSILWKDPEFGVLCKGRLDRVCEYQRQPYILDLKTHGFAATRQSWERSVEKFSYHQQAAFYMRGLSILRPLPDDAPERRFAWGVLETEAPYLVRVFDADDDALQLGMDEIMEYLGRYATCKAEGEWPGWDEGMEIAGLPAWAMKRFRG